MRFRYFTTYDLQVHDSHRRTYPVLEITFSRINRTQIRVPSNMISSNEDLFLDYSEERTLSEKFVLMIPDGGWRPKHRSCVAGYMCHTLGIPIEQTRNILRQVSPRGNVLNSVSINIRINAARVYDYNERPQFLQFVSDWITDQLPSGHNTVAADTSAMEALEKFKFGCDGCDVKEGQCVICFDDFEDGVEVTKMPCSHAFHTDCLTKWLKMNHVCPLCRFHLPC